MRKARSWLTPIFSCVVLIMLGFLWLYLLRSWKTPLFAFLHAFDIRNKKNSELIFKSPATIISFLYYRYVLWWYVNLTQSKALGRMLAEYIQSSKEWRFWNNIMAIFKKHWERLLCLLQPFPIVWIYSVYCMYAFPLQIKLFLFPYR